MRVSPSIRPPVTSASNTRTRTVAKKNISDHLSLPADLVNGIIPTVIGDIDPKGETTLLDACIYPQAARREIENRGVRRRPYSFGMPAKATHYVIKMDIGGITGVAAKVLGKQPPPVDIWVTKEAPTFLRSDAPLYEDGPIWRIELASPVWRK